CIEAIDDGRTWSHLTGLNKKTSKKQIKRTLDQQFIDDYYEEMKDKVIDNIKIEDDHWLWELRINPGGYGETKFLGIGMLAHRLSFMAFNQKFIPTDLLMRHMCNRKDCVNPDHLATGDAKQNSADRIISGTALFGEKCPSAKITASTAKMIFISQILGLQTKIRSELFNASCGIVSYIDHLKSWTEETKKINLKTCIKELRDYINKDSKWIEATKDIDLSKLSTDKLIERFSNKK
ncbi:MAG: hypothetical protein Hyperionvirus12_1, partial [Hyperionvirus sp.]